MLDTNALSGHAAYEAGSPRDLELYFVHPDDVLHKRGLSAAEKRAVLAAWASDAHAIPNVPAMRQLPSGAIVRLDTILAALRELDGSETAKRAGKATRPALKVVSLWPRFTNRHDDDDDDPPPCPAAARPYLAERRWTERQDEELQLAAA